MSGLSAAPATATPRRPRVPAAERERMILEAAIPFFAEHGLEGQTRLLAQSLGISHSVLYRHFPSKDGLIAAVCEEMFRRRWQPEWEQALHAPGLALEERLLRFYRQAATLILSPEWIRLALFVGMAGRGEALGLTALLRERIIRPLASVLGSEAAAWALHGRVFYTGMRLAVWRGAGPRSLEEALEAAIRSHAAAHLA